VAGGELVEDAGSEHLTQLAIRRRELVRDHAACLESSEPELEAKTNCKLVVPRRFSGLGSPLEVGWPYHGG
jgi:hypothetical protein